MENSTLTLEKLNAAIEQWNRESMRLPQPPVIWANKKDGQRIKEFFRTGDLSDLSE